VKEGYRLVDILFLIGTFGFFGFALLVAYACHLLIGEK
jgi:hypothetical protein